MYHILFIHASVGGHSGCFHVLPIVNTTHSNICLFTGLKIYVSTSDLSLDLKLIFMTLLDISTYLPFWSSSHVDLLLPNSCEYATLPISPQSVLRSKSINRYLNHKDRVTDTRFASEQSWFGGQGYRQSHSRCLWTHLLLDRAGPIIPTAYLKHSSWRSRQCMPSKAEQPGQAERRGMSALLHFFQMCQLCKSSRHSSRASSTRERGAPVWKCAFMREQGPLIDPVMVRGLNCSGVQATN